MIEILTEQDENYSYISGYDNEGNSVHYDNNVILPELFRL